MLALLVPFLVGLLVLCIGSTLYGAVRRPGGDPRDRIALRVVALWIAAFWVVSGALAIRAL